MEYEMVYGVILFLQWLSTIFFYQSDQFVYKILFLKKF